FDLERRRPPYYVVNPDIDDIEARYWSSHRIFPIKSTFEDFLNSLDVSIPAHSRALAGRIGGGKSTLRHHYRKADVRESDGLLTALREDMLHIHKNMASESVDPKQFYRGFDVGWGALQQNLDVPRMVTDSLVVEGILLDEEDR